MIKQLILKNFTTFTNLMLEFSPKINVILGENATGKTHLLKVAYGLYDRASLFKNKSVVHDNELQEALTNRLLGLFMPLDGKLGKLYCQGATEQAQITAKFNDNQYISAAFSNISETVIIQDRCHYPQQADAVFIPSKEVLSFMKGFNSLYQKYALSFDQTYQDICLLLDLPRIRSEALQEKSKWVMTEIDHICGGQFIFYGGGEVTFKTKYNEYSTNAMAEGFRKIGMLSRLLETGAIQPGISGPLFWDEPESSLNPKLLKLLVQILLELARSGQQIIIATHDYVLLKWFDLLADKNKEDHVRFHVLYRNSQGQLGVDSVENYRGILPNVIADTFNDLTKEQVNQKMGGLGK